MILALAAEHERLQSVPPGTAPTLTVSVINGGQAINVVPDKCCLLIDRRVVVGEDPAQVAVDLYKYAKKHCLLPLSMRTTHELPAFYQSPDSFWIRQLADWSGIQPSVAPYGTNAWAYCGLAHECVVLGPGSIEQAHRDVEWVAVSELEKVAGIYSQWWALSTA